jgi:hypothetical protein
MTAHAVLDYAAQSALPLTIRTTVRAAHAGVLLIQIRAAYTFDEYAHDHDAFMYVCTSSLLHLC